MNGKETENETKHLPIRTIKSDFKFAGTMIRLMWKTPQVQLI